MRRFELRAMAAATAGLAMISLLAAGAGARGGVVAGGGGGGACGGGGVVAPPVLGVGGGIGAVNVLLKPTTPFGPLNEDPSFVGGVLPSVATIRFVPNRSVLRVDLTNMDPVRFPNVGVLGRHAVIPASPCVATLSIGTAGPTIVPVTAAVAPAAGSAVSLQTTATSVSGAKATVDVVCTFVDARTKALVTHQTHWSGIAP